MNKKMKGIISTSLEVLEIYANRLLKKAQEDNKDIDTIDKNLRVLNIVANDMERLERLISKDPFVDDFTIDYEIAPEDAEKPLTPEEEEQLREMKQMLRFGIEKQEETGEVKVFPMNGNNFITLFNEEDAKFFIDRLLECFKRS